jgi:RNA polymerase sigma-70 factor (ECF subfamily)
MSRSPRIGDAQEGDDVVERARAGSEEAWGVIYDHLHRPLLGYLRFRAVGDPEDALGEVFLRLARSIGRFRGDIEALRRYAFTIAVNYLRDSARRRAARPDLTFLAPDDVEHAGRGNSSVQLSAEDEALVTVNLNDLREAFGELTPDQRHVVYLRFVGDQSVAETAEAMGVSQGAVKQLQRRALRTMRETIQERGTYESPAESSP